MKMDAISDFTGMRLSIIVPAGVFCFVISEGSVTTITLIFQQLPRINSSSIQGVWWTMARVFVANLQ